MTTSLRDVRKFITKRLASIECVDAEQETLEALLELIDDDYVGGPSEFGYDTPSLQDVTSYELLALDREASSVGL